MDKAIRPSGLRNYFVCKRFAVQTLLWSKVESNHTCLAVIRLDSATKKDDNYYPQDFFKRG